MRKGNKIQNFRTLNLEDKKTTPAKKTAGASRTLKNTKNRNANSSKVNSKVKSSKKSPNNRNNKSKKNKQTSKNYAWVLVLFLILVLSGTGVGLLFTPTFDINNVIVDNGVNVTAEEILNKANIEINMNILKINTKKIEEAIETIPYIKNAKVKRVFPSEIKITYTECERYTLIRFLESFVIMDKFGKILEIIKNNEGEELQDLVVIYGINSKEYIPGNILMEENKLKYENIVYMLETMKKDDFQYKIAEMNYEDTGNLKIVMKDMDIDVIYGKIERNILRDKVSHLKVSLSKVEKQEGTIDISSSNYMEKTIFTRKY